MNLTANQHCSHVMACLVSEGYVKKVVRWHRHIGPFSMCILNIAGCEGRICAWLLHRLRRIFGVSFAFEIGFETVDIKREMVESKDQWMNDTGR